MKEMTLLCYGDSNTYGYDPRGYMGMRYPLEIRWTERLKKLLVETFEVSLLEEGMNGRALPDLERSLDSAAYIFSLMEKLKKGDMFIMMLGTNDILLTDYPDSEKAIGKMEDFLGRLYKRERFFESIIVGPPYIGRGIDGSDSYYEESVKLNQGFCRLVSGLGDSKIHFLDAAEWNVPMGFDGVHFSEEGHRVFAENMARYIMDVL